MEPPHRSRTSARAERGSHGRAKGAAPWWERLGEAPPGAIAIAPPAARNRRARPALFAALVLVILALPVLAFSLGGSKGASKVATQRTAAQTGLAGSADAGLRVAPIQETTTVPPTTAAPTTAAPTTAAPTTAAPTTVAKASQTAAPVTAPAPKSTSAPKPPPTTAPPAPAPKAAAPVAPRNSQSGQGTWYNYQPGGCANNSLPMGTVVTVTNVDTGATTTCVVNDRGGFSYPRILDMDASVFQQLAPLGAGVINISISW